MAKAKASQPRVWAFGIGIIVTLWTVLTYGPAVETRLFPVAGDFAIVEPEADGSHGVFRLASTRYRADCGFQWMHLEGVTANDETMLAPTEYFGVAPGNLHGKSLSRKIRVDMNTHVVALTGEVVYRCPFLPWFSRVPIVDRNGEPFPNWLPTKAQDRMP